METIRTVRRMALATAIAVALAPAAQAAIFTVSNADDAGAGSLRAALEAANGGSDVDVVEFDGTFFSTATPRTIALESPLSIVFGVTVNGPGADVLTLDGQENVRVFTLQPSEGSIAVTLSGVTLRDGFGGSGGGCISAARTHLVLEDSVLTGCSGGEGLGGALFIQDVPPGPPGKRRKGQVEPPASLIVRDTTFSANRAMGGGAISARIMQGGDITLDGVTIEENEGFEFGGGAELFAPDSEIELVDSTISGNLAGGVGGGIAAISYSTIRIEDSQFVGNRLQAPSYAYGLYTYGGGAAVIGLGDVLITGTRFENNMIVEEEQTPNLKGDPPPQEDLSGAGGGLFAFPATLNHSVSIAGSQFIGNGAEFGGGAFFGVPDSKGPKKSGVLRRFAQGTRAKALDGTMSIAETRFTNNLAEFAGPGVGMLQLSFQQPPPTAKAVSPGLTFDRVTLSGNGFRGDLPGPFAGAVAILGDAWPVQFINSTLSGNAGGIAMGSPFPPSSDEPVLLLDHTTVADNEFGGVTTGFSSSKGLRGHWAKRLAPAKDYPLPELNIAVRNSVLAGNGGGEGADLSAMPSTVQMLHSLVQTTQPADFTGYQDDGGNQLGVEPLLDPLALAGHPFLEVHVPQAESPLIDAGDPDVLTAGSPPDVDERGAARIAGAAIDIGAVETVSPGSIDFDPAALTVSETDGTATLTAVRSGGAGGEVSVTYATADDSALAGQDYTTAGGTLSWADGEDGAKTFTVPLTDDALVESDETFTATLSEATGGATIGTATATVTLTSDDVPPVGTLAITPTALTVNEPDGTATLSVTRSGGSAGEVSVNYTTGNGSALAGSDYTATSGTLSWAGGDTAAKSIVVPILNDALVEANEQFNVTLAQPSGGATLGASTSTVTIVSEDVAALPGSLQFDGAGNNGMVTLRFNENGTPAAKAIVQIGVTRSGGTAGAASIDYATADGTATAPLDYTATAGTLSWADGEGGTKFIPVNIVEDGLAEPEENFRVVLSNAQGAGLGVNAQAQLVVIANGGAILSGTVTIPAGDTRGWLALLGAMLAAAWVGLRRRN